MPSGQGKRTCESCGGAMPDRMSRQRNDKGQLVCDSCKGNAVPSWTTTHSSLSVLDQSEMRRREAEAITSIVRVRKAKHAGLSVIAHDSGDNAIINHCPFCGSGAVLGGSDGTTTCDFCHTPFTVQVQPAHPFMPQTIDGQPVTPPGMPGGVEQDMSAPVDPTVEETEDDVAADPLGDADPSVPSNGPVRPGQPPTKQPPEGGSEKSQPPWLKNKKSSKVKQGGIERVPLQTRNPNSREEHPYPDMKNYVVKAHAIRVFIEAGIWRTFAEADEALGDRLYVPGIQGNLTTQEKVNEVLAEHGKQGPAWLSKGSARFRTAEGRTLDADAYMARLALEMADDRDEVLESVRLANLRRQADTAEAEESQVECPACNGSGDGRDDACHVCEGSGTVAKEDRDRLLDEWAEHAASRRQASEHHPYDPWHTTEGGEDLYTGDLLNRDDPIVEDLLNPGLNYHSLDLLSDNGHALGPEVPRVDEPWLVNEHGHPHSGSARRA